MRKVNIVTGLAFLVFSAVYYFFLIPTQIEIAGGVGNYTGILKPDYFPKIAIYCFAAFSAILIWQSVRSLEDHPVFVNVSDRPILQVSIVLIIGVIYIFGLEYLGYSIATPIFLIVLMLFFGTRDWRYLIPVAILVPTALHLFFWHSFKIILPEGSLFG